MSSSSAAGSSSPRCSRDRAGGGRRRRRLLSRRRWWPDGLVQRLQPTPFKGTRATASRVSVPRSPPPPPPLPRHESGFLPRRVAETSSPSPHLGSPPALASSGDAPAPGAAGSTEGRWLPVIGVVFCAVQLLPCGLLALPRAGARQPDRCCSCFQLTALAPLG